MNIEQYRALKAQEKQGTQTPEQTPTPQVQVTVQPTQNQEPVKQEPAKEPEKIVIDGAEITLDELKQGYMRTKDYTQKTQEVAHQRKETEEAIKLFEHLKKNPQLVQQLKENQVQVPSELDPATAKVVALEQKVYDMMLAQEINSLKGKYADFDVQKVLKIAQERNIANLEDAYMLTRNNQPADPEALKTQLRQEILRELEAEKVATQTIITTNGSPAPLQDNTPRLSEAEQKVARMMFRGVQDPNAEYVKWRDASGRIKK